MDLFETLGLSDRVVYDKELTFDIDKGINWAAVDERLEQFRACSLDYLKNALQ